MRNGRILAAVAVLAAMVLGGPAQAATTIKWIGTVDGGTYDWFDANNWAGGNIPDSNSESAWYDVARSATIDLKGNVVDLIGTGLDPGEIHIQTKNSGKRVDLVDTVGGSVIKCLRFSSQQWGSHSSAVPIEASEKVRVFWRGVTFTAKAGITTALLEIGDGTMILDPLTTGAYTATKVHFYDDTSSSVTPQLYANDAIVTADVLMEAAGNYYANADGALGTGVVDIRQGNVFIQQPQTVFPADVRVGAWTALAGDTTNAVFTGAGKNVSFVDNSVYAPDPGKPEPTRGDLGGSALLFKGVIDTSSATPVVTGDDGNTAIYKGAALGGWGNSTAINTTLQAVTGSGNLNVAVVGRNADMGSATVLEAVDTQAADLQVVPGAGYVNLVGPINNGVLTGPNATTFNFIGQANGMEHNQVLAISNAAAEIAAGQTFNIQNGNVYINAGSNSTFLKGTLEIDAGGALINNSTAALAASGGTLAFKDRSLMFLAAGQEGMFENINVTESGTPFIVVGNNGSSGGITYTIDDGTELGDLVKASNIWCSAAYDWLPITFGGAGVLMGDGKWIQSVDGPTRDPHVGGIVRAEPGTTIGFASMGVTRGRTFYIDANTEAAGATVLFNTTETLETSVFNSTNTAGNHHSNNRSVDTVVPNRPIVVAGMITAETIKAQNGLLDLRQDLNVPNLDIAGGASVKMATDKTATVTGTLSGTGNWTGGLGVTVVAGAKVAPGEGVGVLNDGGGVLTIDNGAIYQWQIADPTGDPNGGEGWDLVKGSTIDFLGELILDVDDSLLVGSIDVTDSFIVASASSSMSALGSYSFLGTWSGTLTVTGNDLILTDLSGALVGDADGDGDVDAADYITLKTNMGQPSGAELADGDFDGDGDVDWNDLQLLQAHYGESAGASGTIPEPATLGLLAIGAMAVIRRRRRS